MVGAQRGYSWQQHNDAILALHQRFYTYLLAKINSLHAGKICMIIFRFTGFVFKKRILQEYHPSGK